MVALTKKSIICHLFYPAVASELVGRLQRIRDNNTSYFINIQGSSREHKELQRLVYEQLGNAHILTTPNKGRDIGAKLLLIQLMLQLKIKSEFTLIIHDKKSPHLDNGDFWREELFKIIDEKYLKKVFDTFYEQKDAGIVGAGKYIQNEYDDLADHFSCSSNQQIKELIRKYNIKTKDYHFLAGNILWIRTELLENFFRQRSLLQIHADLESGNALDFYKGTYIHSWERIMSWIATSQGYKIYGV